MKKYLLLIFVLAASLVNAQETTVGTYSMGSWANGVNFEIKTEPVGRFTAVHIRQSTSASIEAYLSYGVMRWYTVEQFIKIKDEFIAWSDTVQSEGATKATVSLTNMSYWWWEDDDIYRTTTMDVTPVYVYKKGKKSIRFMPQNVKDQYNEKKMIYPSMVFTELKDYENFIEILKPL